MGSLNQVRGRSCERSISARFSSLLHDVFFFRQQIHFFANFLACSLSRVSFSPSGASFSATFFTTRAFFTPNRPHRIGPYPGHTNVPPRPRLHQARPPYPPHPGQKETLPISPTRPNPRVGLPPPCLAASLPSCLPGLLRWSCASGALPFLR